MFLSSRCLSRLSGIIVPVTLEVPKGRFKDCTLLTGFHGVGETGYIAVSFLVHALNAKRVGFIRATRPPAFVTTSKKGLVTPYEIYRDKNLVMVKLEFPPHKNDESEVPRVIAQWAIQEKFRDALLVGGLDVGFKNGKHDLRIATTKACARSVKKLGVPHLEQGLYVYGPLAVMLTEFEMKGFPAVAILPYADSSRSDPGAAATAIKSISQLCNLNVNVSELENYARVLEADMDQRVKITKNSLQGMYV
jgi:uncharacterized protein